MSADQTAGGQTENPHPSEPFMEGHSQINLLNAKTMYDAWASLFLDGARAHQEAMSRVSNQAEHAQGFLQMLGAFAALNAIVPSGSIDAGTAMKVMAAVAPGIPGFQSFGNPQPAAPANPTPAA
jgi:hypothetical protein